METIENEIMDMELEEEIYKDLCRKFNFDMNRVSLTGLLFCLEDSKNNVKITKKYEGYSPMEFLTKYKINLMFECEEIDLETKLDLLSAYKDYNEAIVRIYNAESDLKHKYRAQLKNGNLSIKEFNNKLKKHIEKYEKEKTDNERVLNEYELPIKFDLDTLLDKYNRVTTDKTYRTDDELGITYRAVKQKFNHIFYNRTVDTPLERIANPTKYYGKYSKYTVIEFLTIYKIRRMYKCGEISQQEMNNLIKIYNNLLDFNLTKRYNELPEYMVEELERYNLPLKFDLDGIMYHYGKNQIKGKEKIK